ncbi:MAG: hypothetical protein D6802_10530 [Ardenticatenia bacterium]|nr:MAG: hypothetical protein D6802_10530 [Ardenticatenia bacterium]
MSDEPKLPEQTAIGWALFDAADFKGAAQRFDMALHNDPTDVEALRGRARLHLMENDVGAAIILLEHALAVLQTGEEVAAPADAEQRARRDLAWAYYRLNRFDLAAEQFAALGERARANKLAALGGRTPYRRASNADSTALPLVARDPVPFVLLTLGNRDHLFVVDTGTGELTLDVRLLDELGLPSFGVQPSRTAASDRHVAVHHTVIPRLRLGDIVLENVPAEAEDIQSRAPQISGFIGFNLLAQFCITVDLPGGMLYLEPPRARRMPDGATPVPFWLLDDHLLLVPGALNGREHLFAVASGFAGAALSAPPSTFTQSGVSLESGMPLQGVSGSGTHEVTLLRVEELRVGPLALHDVEALAGLFSPSLEWRYGFRIGGLVGHEALRTVRWTLDLASRAFWFERED